VDSFERTHVFRNDRYGDDQLFFDYSKDTAYWPRWDRRDEPNELVDQDELQEKANQRGDASNLSNEGKKALGRLLGQTVQGSERL
jgi:hypothetical protein